MQQALKWAVPIAFIAHGLGMVGGIYFVFASKSWFGDLFGGSVLLARILVAALWLVSGAAFIAAGWGFWRELEWWRTAAWVAAPTSIIGIGLWAGAVPPGTYIGGVMAAATLVALALGW